MIGYNHKDADILLPAGDYQATLKGAEEKQSRAGNDMYEITLVVYANNREITLIDYIVFPAFTWKLRKLAVALGAEDAFAADKFDPGEYVDRNLTVSVDIQPGQGDYPERNRIKSYAPKNGGVRAESSIDDDLPF